jgi:hypothetical protein
MAGSSRDQSIGSSRNQSDRGSTGAGRLKRVEVRRAVRDGPESVWSLDAGRAISGAAAWAVYQHPDGLITDWIFIHRATGLQAPGLYAKTLKGAAPVLAALEPCGRFVTAERPGDAGPPAAMKLMREEIAAALRTADVSGLESAPMAGVYFRKAAPADAAASAAHTPDQKPSPGNSSIQDQGQ